MNPKTKNTPMTRLEAIEIVMSGLGERDAAIHANGAISRESFSVSDREGNFYLAGSMGLPAPVGLGLALSQPKRKTIIMDGDGNLLMGLGALALVGAVKPANFIHIVLDNGVYATTGGQATLSPLLNLETMATASGYARAIKITDPGSLKEQLSIALSSPGPHFLRIMVDSAPSPPLPRIPRTCRQTAERFHRFCQN